MLLKQQSRANNNLPLGGYKFFWELAESFVLVSNCTKKNIFRFKWFLNPPIKLWKWAKLGKNEWKRGNTCLLKPQIWGTNTLKIPFSTYFGVISDPNKTFYHFLKKSKKFVPPRVTWPKLFAQNCPFAFIPFSKLNGGG